ncbi:MAG: C45 family peptidase [Actinomycetota bacterium]|nr:C45 family peptidase [Actinomycetota bacterium]
MTIPIIRAHGSHREAGWVIGVATADTIRRAAADPFDAALARGFRAVTVQHLPRVVEELDAAAEAAGADPLGVFAASVEELASPALAGTGCSDLVVTGARTADGHLLVAHTNDLEASLEKDVVAVERHVDGEPTIFTLGVGPWLSVGWNGAGLSVTGNELTPADDRVGIPRLLQMRDVVARRTVREAIESILHPARASSYNWVLAHRDGEVANVEGSATAAAVTEPVAGALAHANDYRDPEMRLFEANRRAADSAKRCERAERLLAETAGERLTVDRLRELLSDHVGAPDSLCRHGDHEGVKTVFWCIADVTAGTVVYGRGNPCESDAETYAFAA